MRTACLGLFAVVSSSLLLAQARAPLPQPTTAKQKSNLFHDPSPHTIRFVTVDKHVRLEVLDWGGTGRPVVLLTGVGNTAHVFDDFAPKLTGKYHVYGITRRGFGASSAPDSGYTADRLGDDVLAVLDSLRIDRPVLVGHSLAGEELSSVGSRRPERVAGLIYLDAAYHLAYYDDAHQDFQIDYNELKRKLELMHDNPDTTLVKGLLHTDLPRFERDLQKYVKDVATPTSASASPPSISPTLADRASFRAYGAWWRRVRGLALPEAEFRQMFRATPGGGVADPRTKQAVRDAITGGEQAYSAIHVPILAIYAVPRDFGGQLNGLDSAARVAYEETFNTSVETQAAAFERGMPQARVVRLPHANHYVFLSNQNDVLREVSAFVSSLPP
jgi:non-heme chloroperoxidase